MTTAILSTASEVSYRPDQLPPDSIVFGRTAYMQTVRTRMEKAAALDIPVLLEGESGTGKDIIAQMLHRRSSRMSGVFVKASCSSFPESFDEFLEPCANAIASDARTSADNVQTDCYGTLFLDEISESSAALQVKLLRLFQEGQLCRINLKRCALNLRLVCATNCWLQDAAERGTFRKDLLYRINVLTMRMPPLRERIVDIPELIHYFLDSFTKAYKCEAKGFSRRMLQLLLSHSWPGNIRELENLIKRYVLFGCDESICEEFVGSRQKKTTEELSEPGAVSLKEITRKAVRQLERDAILKVLEANHWNRKRAACVLNISYRALLYKLKDAGMVAAAPAESRLKTPTAADTR